MDNAYAWRLGEAASKSKPGGDYIDHGWSLLKELHARGFDVVPRDLASGTRLEKSLNEICGLVTEGTTND